MGGYGTLVLNTIGTAVEPILLLIGEENKHHGVLEVLRETIEAFPGVFDDTADMMRHGKARYAVEKGDDGLKYRVLDYDVAPQLPERQLRAQQANISQKSQKSDNQSAKVNQRLEAQHLSLIHI